MDANKLLAASLYAIAKTFVQAGAQPTKALMYASFVLIEDTYGREKIEELGITPSTARYTRKNIRDLDLSKIEDEQAQHEILVQAAAFIENIEKLMQDGRVKQHIDAVDRIIEENAQE